MKNLLKIITLGSFLFTSTVFAASPNALAQFAKKENIPYSQNMDIYLIQYAKSGTLSLLDAKQNHYLLTLNDVSPTTTYFSDRPNHISGQVSTESLNLENTQGRYASFSGVLSYFYEGNTKNLNSIVLEFDKYQYNPKTQQIICKVHLGHALPGASKMYQISGVILQFDSGFFDVSS